MGIPPLRISMIHRTRSRSLEQESLSCQEREFKDAGHKTITMRDVVFRRSCDLHIYLVTCWQLCHLFVVVVFSL